MKRYMVVGLSVAIALTATILFTVLSYYRVVWRCDSDDGIQGPRFVEITPTESIISPADARMLISIVSDIREPVVYCAGDGLYYLTEKNDGGRLAIGSTVLCMDSYSGRLFDGERRTWLSTGYTPFTAAEVKDSVQKGMGLLEVVRLLGSPADSAVADKLTDALSVEGPCMLYFLKEGRVIVFRIDRENRVEEVGELIVRI